MSVRSLIIVAVDGSPETEPTVEYAVSLAKARSADLHAIQVVPRRRRLWVAPQHDSELEARLRSLQASADVEGVLFRIVTLRGAPESVIAAYAQLNAVSLIVVGRHFGASPLWRNAAVASRLSRLSPVPVIVVPKPLGRMEPASVQRILVAIDFTVASAFALRTAVELAKRHGAHLTLLHSTGAPLDMEFSAAEALRVLDQLDSDAKVIVEHLKTKALALGSRDADALVVTGDAHRGIVDAAATTAADLIVMGVAPRTWMEEATFGSTLRQVVRHAKIPVFVVPVVAGAHEWIDEVNDEDTLTAPAPAQPRARYVA